MWGQCWAESFHIELISSLLHFPLFWPAHTQLLHTGCWCRHVQPLVIREVPVDVCVIKNPHLWPPTPSSCHPQHPHLPYTSSHPSLCFNSEHKISLWSIETVLCLSNGLIDFLSYILHTNSAPIHTVHVEHIQHIIIKSGNKMDKHHGQQHHAYN